MTRFEAFQTARAQVVELCTPPVKANGYVVDGWRPPSPSELVALTLKVAEFLLADDSDTND